jgi:hypothetical protein
LVRVPQLLPLFLEMVSECLPFHFRKFDSFQVKSPLKP